MKLAVFLVGLTKCLFVMSLPFKKSQLLHREARSSQGHVGCMHMESLPGDMSFEADGSGAVCGLYIIAKPEELIEIEFTSFDIDCEQGGLLAIVDGWELNGQFFPNADDHPLPIEEQYRTYCGVKTPTKRYISSQNVALIQNRILKPGQGFSIRVKFIKNPQPCNAVYMADTGIYTLKNYGNRRNCTLAIIFPEVVQLVAVDVGVTAERKSIEAEFGLMNKCETNSGSDMIEVMGGYGFDTQLMPRNHVICGLQSTPAKSKIVLGCENSVVRMVSSGKYYNTVTFQFTPPVVEELDSSSC